LLQNPGIQTVVWSVENIHCTNGALLQVIYGQGSASHHKLIYLLMTYFMLLPVAQAKQLADDMMIKE
jgi:hypothetical protein